MTGKLQLNFIGIRKNFKLNFMPAKLQRTRPVINYRDAG